MRKLRTRIKFTRVKSAKSTGNIMKLMMICSMLVVVSIIIVYLYFPQLSDQVAYARHIRRGIYQYHGNEALQTGTPDIPAEIKWHMVPENSTENEKWSVEVIGAFFDYRLNVVAVSLSSDAAKLLSTTLSPPYTFYCIFTTKVCLYFLLCRYL